MADANLKPAGSGFLTNLKADLLASIAVFLVVVPLCIAIAHASGVPAEKAAAVGILSGVVGGLLVGLLGGCPLQVTGPAAGLAVIVAQHIENFGYERLGLIVMVAGGFQLLAGIVGMGQWFRAVSPAVIQGMLAGIGVLIFAAQFHYMVDDVPPGKPDSFGGVVNLYTIPRAVYKGVTEEAHRPAAALGLLTIVVVVGWSTLTPRKLRMFPAPLAGVLLATIVANVLHLNPNWVQMPDQFFSVIALPSTDQAWWGLNWSIIGAGAAMAFVASAESLLTATAADTMQQHAPRTRYDRELAAQGVGNVVSGLIGGLPVTGVIVRTGANIQAGARTRAATIMQGFWLLIFAIAFPQVLRLIPVASLAAILVYTGYKLMNPKPVKELLKYGKSEVAIYAATLMTIVVFNLLAGIAVGIGLALVKLLYTFSHLRVRLREEDGRTILYLEGAATFVRLPRLARVLEKVIPSTELHVHFEGLTYIDHACLDLLMNWEKQHEATGGSLVIDWESLTARFHAFRKKDNKHREAIASENNGPGNNGDERARHQVVVP